MKNSNHSVFFHYLTSVSLPNRMALRTFIEQLFIKECIALEAVSYIFCSDSYLHQLNVEYLQHDTFTDIITFPLSKENEPIISDIYISIDRVRENAATLHSTINQELHRVIFHGALHLCNYKDKTPVQQKLMHAKENYYLSLYFVSRETI